MNRSVSFSNSFSNSNGNSTCNSSTSSLSAKLRRLKIEESILLQSINGNSSVYSEHNIDADPNFFLTFTEFKQFFEDTKTTFNNLKRLFQDIKASTSSKEVLESVDIDDIKKNTLELENNIRMYKVHLQKELTALKAAERQLNEKLNDPITTQNLKRKPRVQTAKYTEIVQSPVKTLMTSPLKSSEVHEFQEFMKNSKNRYGGWDEYHHNVFVNIWQKHCNNEDPNESILSIEKAAEYNLFLRELQPKLIGISEEEIITHINWYSKYLCLKNLQQKAIDKWRSNRRKMKPSNIEIENLKAKSKSNLNKTCTQASLNDNINNKSTGFSNNKAQDLLHQDYLPLKNGDTRFSLTFTRKCFSDDMLQECITNNGAINNDLYAENDEKAKQNFLKATKQWSIKCTSENQKRETNFINIDGIQKRGTPFWRAGL